MNVIRIKRTQSEDKSFKDLIVQLDRDLNTRYNREQSKYDKYNKIESISTVIVACHGEKPVGCGCFREYDRETVEMKRMFVIPDYRGQRISKQLLKELEVWAKEQGYSKAVLETGSGQPEAIGLYTKSGYERIENYGPYITFPNSLCFEKKL